MYMGYSTIQSAAKYVYNQTILLMGAYVLEILQPYLNVQSSAYAQKEPHKKTTLKGREVEDPGVFFCTTHHSPRMLGEDLPSLPALARPLSVK